MKTDNVEPRKFRAKTVYQSDKRVFTPAVKKHAVSRLLGAPADFKHQRWAVHPLLISGAERSERPNHGHAVRRGDVRVIQDVRYLGMIASHDDAVHRCHADIARRRPRHELSFVGPLVAQLDHFGVTRLADTDTND